MMHKEIEVYVDDMIAKSQGEKDHVVNLRKLFERLRKFQLKLIQKMYFWSYIRKIARVHGQQERNRDLPPPRTQKEVRSFMERLNYLT